jgi:ectoine hydroxylase-related dioxygenase (phytanoyl-CoA dioxygenase family)
MRMETFIQREMRTKGYVGPIRLFSQREAVELRRTFLEEAGIDTSAPGPAPRSLARWHWAHDWVWEMATRRELLDIAEEILGPDLVLWNTAFWYKPPVGQKRVPWHQEGVLFRGIEPRINLTAWIALTPTSVENGCLRVIPSEDRTLIPHVPEVPDSTRRLDHRVPPEHVDESRAVDLEMSPGEVLFFDEGLIHRSGTNLRPGDARVGFSVRLTKPEVRFKMDEWDVSPENVRLFLVRGQDPMHLNDALYMPRVPAASA